MKPTIYSRFKELVTTQPDHPAISDERSCVTYNSLDQLADTLLSRFPTYVPARVGVVMDHSVEMVAAIMAIVKAGGAFVPVEPDFPAERMTRYLTECGVDFVVTQEKYSSKLRGFTLFIVGQQINVDPTLHPLPDRSVASRPAYIMYSSSYSGYPIGVVVGNTQVVDLAERFGDTFKITPDDVLLQYSACIVNTYIQEVFGTILNGAVLAIPSAGIRNNTEKLMQFADEQYVSIISGFPYLMHELNRMPALPITVRMLISGGQQLAADSINHLLEQVTVYNTYGPAEATSLATCYCCNNGHTTYNGYFARGKALEGVEIILLDDELQPVAPGKEGEICIAGNGVADSFTGDHRDEQMSSIVILQDGTRVARTGDVGRILPDGNLVLVRRKANEVNILGRRVVTGEIERALLSTGEVTECVVEHYQDEKGAAYLVAYVVPGTQSFSLSWVKNSLAQYLPPYMIPEFFVLLRQLPVTATGEVNTLALPVVLKDSVAG